MSTKWSKNVKNKSRHLESEENSESERVQHRDADRLSVRPIEFHKSESIS